MTGAVRMDGSETQRAVVSAHEDLVDNLYGYRSDLIHVSIDASGASASMAFDQGAVSYQLDVTAPKNFMKRCAKGVGLEHGEAPSLLAAADALIATSERHSAAILTALCNDLDPDNQPLSIVG